MAAGERRSSSGNAVTTTLSASIGAADTSLPFVSSTGYPDGTNGPFFIRVDSETIKCIGRTGLNVTVQTTPVTGRGWEGTVASTHNGMTAVVNFAYTSTDADDANKHYADITVDNHTQYLNPTRHDTTTRHPASVLPLGSPGNSAPGDTAAAGSASTIARSDHRHGREADSTSRVGCTLEAASFSCPTNTPTTITWTTETSDPNNFITVPSTTLTIPSGKDGLYSILVSGSWTNVFTENRGVFITAGGLLYPIPLLIPLSGLGGAYVQNWTGVLSPVPLVAGNTIVVVLDQSNAASQATSAHINLYRVAG